MTPDVNPEELSWLIDGLMVLMHGIAEAPENDGSELPRMQTLLNRLTGQQDLGRQGILDEMAVLGQQIGGYGATVCTTHLRFVPCRTRDKCVMSEDPEDVARVTACQQGERDGADK